MSDKSKTSVSLDGQKGDKAKAPHETNQLSTDELASVTGGRTAPPSEGGSIMPPRGADPRLI